MDKVCLIRHQFIHFDNVKVMSQLLRTVSFSSQQKGKSKMKDYGNMSSSGNNSVDDMIDNLYHFEYEVDIDLPLDIIEDKPKMSKPMDMDKKLDKIQE